MNETAYFKYYNCTYFIIEKYLYSGPQYSVVHSSDELSLSLSLSQWLWQIIQNTLYMHYNITYRMKLCNSKLSVQIYTCNNWLHTSCLNKTHSILSCSLLYLCRQPISMRLVDSVGIRRWVLYKYFARLSIGSWRIANWKIFGT